MTGAEKSNRLGNCPSRVGIVTCDHDGTDTGMVSCYNARTGEPYYHQTRLPKTYSFKSSPVGANGKLYLASENEDVVVLRMGEKFEVLQTNKLADDDMTLASPAISSDRLLIRTVARIYCIRKGTKD